MFKKLLLFSCLALSFVSAQAGYVPLALTGFNTDAVANGSGAPTGSTSPSISTGFDSQGYWITDSTFVSPTYGAPTVPCMPTNLSVTSAQDPALQWTLQSYSGNNVLRINNIGTDSLVLNTPQSAGELYILYTNVTTGTAGSGNVSITVNFTDGTSQAASTLSSVPNWFYNATYPGTLAKVIGGRLNNAASGGGWQNNNSTTGGPLLYQYKVTILAANYTKTIRSITFGNNVTGNLFNVFGITANSVCSGSVTAGATASSAGSSACPSVNMTLSLPTATSGVGITYQWQSSTTGGAPWTNLGTTSTQTSSQTVATTYRAYIACSGGTADTSTPITLTMKPANQCYCIPSNTTNPTTYYITGFSTTGGTTNITNNASGAGTTSQGYSDFSGTMSASGMQTTTINWTATHPSSTYGYQIWVDWDQNGDFTGTGENVVSTGYLSSPASGSFVIPPTALPGTTRMRIRNAYSSNPSPICGAFAYGEAEDYSFTVIALPNCTGTPVQATTTASAAYVCPTDALTLTANGNAVATGLTNQWQSSIDGGLTWQDITGATTNPYTVTGQTVATLYRDKQQCTVTSSPFVNSTVVSVGARACYCTPTFTSGCSTWRFTNVTFGTVNNSPSASNCAVSNYTNLSANVTAAIPFTVSMTTNQYCAAAVYVDLNNDGDFNDQDELLYSEPYSGNATSTVTPAIILPGYVATGSYRMRLLCTWGTVGSAGTACNTYQYGDFHDYTLNVTAAAPCVGPTAQPTALTLSASATIANVSFTAASPVPDRYLIVRTQGAPLNTTPVNGTNYVVGGTLGNGTVVSNSSAITLTDANLTPSTSYTYTVFAENALCSGGPLYLTTAPISGTVSTTALGIYSWNGSVSTDWTVPANWTPARSLLDPTDVLQFNNAVVDTAKNIPNQTIRRLVVNNNTTAYLQSNVGTTLTIGDTVLANTDLDITAGSSLISNGNTQPLTLAFTGANNTVNIAGTLESISNAVNNVFNFAGTTATVTAVGTIAEGGSNATSGGAIINSTATNLLVNGLFNYKYTTNTIGFPLASFNTGSTMLVSGYTTVTGGPNGNQNQTFYNFTYNCPNQTSVANWSATGALNVLNNFSVISTGTGTWQYATTQAYNAQVKNYIQTGGTFDLEGASSTTSQVFNVSGNFTKTGGTLKASGTTAASQPTINFNGTTAQTASFDVAPTGSFVYRISNNAGINLVGTAGLSSFPINSNGGIRITTTAVNPISTTLPITYSTTNTTLYYDTTGSYTMTANVWPTTNGPQNLTIATGNSSNVVTMPFSRTVPGALTMTSGDINIASNTLTLGTSATVNGTLNYTAGNIRVTTGTFVRWYGTTGAPTSIANTGLFPISFGALNRGVNVFFGSATALSAGGTIAAGHTNVAGLTTGLSVADGAYTINQRTNASWNVTPGNGLTIGTGTMNVRLSGNGLFTSNTPANLRVMQASAVAGVHVAGSAPANAQRSGLTAADLAVPYYIGAATADMNASFIAINTGAWSTGTTWDGGIAPGLINDAYINSGVVVTTTGATNVAKSLIVLPGGNLTVGTGGTVTIDSAMLNNGTTAITGGTLTINGGANAGNGFANTNLGLLTLSNGTMNIGPAGGSNKVFNNGGGTSTVSGGTLNLNGNMILSSGIFNQTNGTINIDPNSGTAATSVASGTVICLINGATVSCTGGNLIFVDPPHTSYATGSGVNRTLNISSNSTLVNFSGSHTVQCGDGVSTTPGNAEGFVLEDYASSLTAINNLIVNGGNTSGRWVTASNNNSSSYGLHLRGSLTINANSELRTGTTAGNSGQFFVGGNILNNGTLTTLGTTLTLGSSTTYSPTLIAVPATISGTGIFRNNTTAPTAFVRGMTINNSGGVTINVGANFPFSGTVTFSAGSTGPSRIIMPGGFILTELAGAGQSGASLANGWVVGRYQKAAATGGMNNNYPIGDLNYYAPINVTGTVLTAGSLWASTTAGDHPSLGLSTINPGASVNRYYSLDTTGGITFTPTTVAATFNYNAADLDANVIPANFVIGEYKGTTWSYPTIATPTATSIKATGLDNNISGQFAVGEACTPINISIPPASATACIGGSATFSVRATPKAGITYQWYRGTTLLTGSTDSVFTIPVVAATDAGNYTVKVTSGCTSVTPVTSTIAVLTVNTPASITTQPAATQNICEGSPVTFTVAAAGTNVTYRWKKGGVLIPGATSASYTIPVVAPADAGSYTVEVVGSAPCGFVASSPSVLTVKPLPLTITAAGTTSFCVGSSVVLNAPVLSPNTLTYLWQNNGGPISGQTSSSYTASTSGTYTAVITNTANGCSNTSNGIIVNANGAPQAVVNPAGAASFCQGTSVTLHGNSVSGLTYKWFLNGNTASPVGLDSTLVVTAAGSYTLQVAIGAGCSTTSTATVVTVTPLPTITTTPTGAQSICQNDTLTIGAQFTGATLVWKLNGSPVVPAATGSSYKAFAAGNYTVTATSTTTGCVNTSAPVALTVNSLPTVTVTSANAATFCAGLADTLKAAPTTGLSYVWNLGANPVTPSATSASYPATASGSYTVTVTDVNGCKKTSTPIAVTVNPLPNVVVTPSLPLTMCSGQTNSLCVPTATGQTYQWSDANGPLTGSTSACLAVTTAGTYSVKVTNTATGCNATSSANTVVVNPTPTATITNTGASTACVGDTICLNANTGTGLTYQWRINGNPIVGATTSTYCTVATGNYTVVVTNGSNCSATSAIQSMTFNPRPTSIISYTTPVTFCDGGAVVLTGVSNTGITYQWMNNGAAITGATSNNYIASSTGNYSVKITNSFGCSTTSQSLLVVNNPIPNAVITQSGQLLSTGNYATYQWYFNSQPISGATNQSYFATQMGGYAVAVTDANGCTDYSDVFFFNNLGVGGGLSASSIKVYPNPVRSTLNIEAPAQVNVIVRDLTGRLIMKVDNAKQIDMSNVADGSYMLMISDKNGNMIKTDKVMKVSQ